MGLLGGKPEPQKWSYRCSPCSMNYPMAGPCQICGDPTDPISNDPPDADWEEKVERANAPDPEFFDKPTHWRFEQLVFAGAPVKFAEKLAADRTVDLHMACRVFREAPLDLAVEILL